jgi:hypothetical protein
MRTTRTIAASLAAVRGAAALAGPAAAGQRGAIDSAKAKVYVPPAPETATRQGQRWLEVHPAAQNLPDARKTANVYVPPFGQHATTSGGSYADQVSSLSNEQLAAAYGTAVPTWIPTPAVTTVASDDDTNGWRIAAIAGGAMLAALALGTAVVLRRRPARTVM